LAGDGFSSQQFLFEDKLAEHVIVAFLIVGRKDKVVDVPNGSGGHGHVSVGEVVDYRALFRHAERVFPHCRRG
jgi:hypothetical protein